MENGWYWVRWRDGDCWSWVAMQCDATVWIYGGLPIMGRPEIIGPKIEEPKGE